MPRVARRLRTGFACCDADRLVMKAGIRRCHGGTKRLAPPQLVVWPMRAGAPRRRSRADRRASAPRSPARASVVATLQLATFFMEELLGILVDSGVIVTTSPTDPERWRLIEHKLRGVQVPPTLVGLLPARLDGLPEAERRARKHANVIGPVFWDEALERSAPIPPNALDALTQRELTRARVEDSSPRPGSESLVPVGVYPVCPLPGYFLRAASGARTASEMPESRLWRASGTGRQREAAGRA